MDEVTVALVALGGYGNFYLKHLFEEQSEHGCRLVAGIDPDPRGCQYLDRFEAESIPIYTDLGAFYRERHADLVVIAAPPHLHAPFTVTALRHGSNVLCEKPLAPTIQEAREMMTAEASSGCFVAIGYQWSFSPAIQALKADVMAGRLGRPRRLRTKVLWPRTRSYYHRNNWAGRIKTGDGRWVLDSPASNATAHYLHNCFYVLGATVESSAMPVDVVAELYRANPIENYDTAAIRCHTGEGIEILYYAAHPVHQEIGPTLRYEFERAVVTYDRGAGPLQAEFRDGRTRVYGDPYEDEAAKLWQAVACVRTGDRPVCGLAAASAHTLCINGAQESPTQIITFPDSLIRSEGHGGDELIYVDGLLDTLGRCYDEGRLPSECEGVMWAQRGRQVDLRHYDRFPTHVTAG